MAKMVNNKKYTFSFTGASALTAETMVIAEEYYVLKDWKAVEKSLLDNNLLNKVKQATFKREFSEIEKRLSLLTQNQLELMIQGNLDDSKAQLKKIGGMEFYDVYFSYIDLEDNEEHFVGVPESGGKSLIPEGDLPAGTVYAIGKNADSSHKGLFRLDIQRMLGNGKISDTVFGGGTAIKEELKEAVNYVRLNLNRITQTAKFSDFEFHLKATDLNDIGNTKGLELAMFLSIVSSIVGIPLIPQLAILGSMSIGGAIIGSDNLGEYLQVSEDSGAKKVLIPAVDMAQLAKVPADLISKFSLVVYSDPVDAAFKALGLG